jgi:transposase
VAFRQEIAEIEPSKLVFVDESGIDNNEAYQYGWALRGERLFALKPGKRTTRFSIIGALNKSTFFAPFIFEGHCDSGVFLAYLKHVLIPMLTPGQYVILDNVSFHKNAKVRALIEDAGCYVKYLPPYSPDLNLIEHWWHSLKTNLRKALSFCNFNLYKAVDFVFDYFGKHC